MNTLNKNCPVLLETTLLYVTDHPNHESLLRYLIDQGYEEQLELMECVTDVVEENYDFVLYVETDLLEQWFDDGDC